MSFTGYLHLGNSAFEFMPQCLQEAGDRRHGDGWGMAGDSIAAKEGVQTVTIDSHSGDKVKDADYSDSDSVKYHYEISMIDGLLTQKVTKEVNAALNKNSGEWDIRLDEGGSSNLLTNVWKLTLDSRDQTYGKTVGHVADEKLQSLIEAGAG